MLFLSTAGVLVFSADAHAVCSPSPWMHPVTYGTSLANPFPLFPSLGLASNMLDSSMRPTFSFPCKIFFSPCIFLPFEMCRSSAAAVMPHTFPNAAWLFVIIL